MSDLRLAHVVPLHPWRLRDRLIELLSSHAEAEAIRRSSERLAEYDDRLLDDIGLTREQATGCAPRPGWAAPDWWKTRPL
ncbi:DUF1127 domain-containing protein [Rubellimicrobium aerolatum]|uniref:DUF1127 domain-containing protein n=1 Tax=Rubellimicrobium aerolatum TaxID=490979 RepID=A0ABW0S976_9RHOB|nr:DUF1127 domain-containing protein [Rubellimicrobium aerolatum]MBP1804782.1 uncharacterized protein YjiS (DUF1127 family) [Rubellimicrobium aerolatum]